VTSFHHQPEAQHPKSSAIHKNAGRLPHLWVDAVEKGLRTSPNSDSGDSAITALEAAMMGRRSEQWSLFYQFRLDERIPKDHLLRRIDRFVTAALGDIHDRLEPYYSEIGRVARHYDQYEPDQFRADRAGPDRRRALRSIRSDPERHDRLIQAKATDSQRRGRLSLAVLTTAMA
jgi:hypothetical protein